MGVFRKVIKPVKVVRNFVRSKDPKLGLSRGFRRAKSIYKKYPTAVQTAGLLGLAYATRGKAGLRAAGSNIIRSSRYGRSLYALGNRPAAPWFRRAVYGNIQRARAYRAGRILAGKRQYVRAMWPRGQYLTGLGRQHRLYDIRMYAGL